MKPFFLRVEANKKNADFTNKIKYYEKILIQNY